MHIYVHAQTSYLVLNNIWGFLEFCCRLNEHVHLEGIRIGLATGESPDTFRQKTGPRGGQAVFSFGRLQPDLTKFVPVPVKATLDKRVPKKAKNEKEKKSPISSGFAENGTDRKSEFWEPASGV
jgi:hypothetical protein